MTFISHLFLAGVVIHALISPADGIAQQTTPPGPVFVTEGKIPTYPIPAWRARISGIVRIRVTTDGERSKALEVVSGPPMLAKAAQENVKTWAFAPHDATSFLTTFEYVLEEPAECGSRTPTVSALLKLPLEIKISALNWLYCDPAARRDPETDVSSGKRN